MTTTSPQSPTPHSPHEAAVPLQGAVRFALDAMADLRRLPPAILEGGAEAALRRALAGQPRSTRRDSDDPVSRGAAAARSACAHLAARAWREAHTALLDAMEHLAAGTWRDGHS